MHLIAVDTVQNVYHKTLKVEDSPYGPIVDLGGYNRYYYGDIIASSRAPREKFYLDTSGRCHRGYPVWISYRALIQAIEVMLKEKANETHKHTYTII